MRWSRDQSDSRVVTRFAWRPITDPASGITVWLERVRLTQERHVHASGDAPCVCNPYQGSVLCDGTDTWVTVDVSLAPMRGWGWLMQKKQEYYLLLLAATWWLFWSLADELISRYMLPGFIEDNPYARNEAGRFVFLHAAFHDAAYLLVYLAFGLVFVWGLGKKHRSWSQLPGALLLMWYALEHFEGFLSNLWAHLGWYVPNAWIYR